MEVCGLRRRASRAATLKAATCGLTIRQEPGSYDMIRTTALLIGALALPVQHPDLSGHWALNQAQSENPRDMIPDRDSSGGRMRGGERGGRGGFGGRRGGFGGGRGGYRGGGGGMSEEQRARMRQTMDLVFTAPASLVISG